MEFKTDPDSELAKSAESFWKAIDVESMAPVLHGPPPTPEEIEWAENEMRKIKHLQKLYQESLQKPSTPDTSARSV